MALESGQVVYRRNGAELYRSLVAPRYPLLVDVSLATRGATVKDVVLAGVLERVAVAPPVLSVPSGVYAEAVTVVVTAEGFIGGTGMIRIEEHVSDCVISLDHRVSDQISTRRLRVVKYRGSRHGTNEYPFLIDDQGLRVLPITAAARWYSMV